MPPGTEITKRDQRPKNKILVKRLYLVTILFLIIGSLSYAGFLFFNHTSTSPVPLYIRNSVSFPIYYPDTTKLPVGYYLDPSSFSSGGNAVLLTLDGPSNIKIIFSEQPKPSSAVLQIFINQRMPLNTQFSTSIGPATIGVINNQSFTSLPVNNANTWIFVEAPLNISQRQLNQVLSSIRS